MAPVQWMPGALSAMLPLFATIQSDPGMLYFRADDPNLYGVYTVGLMASPVVEKGGAVRAANKGFNFYSAPWSIIPLPCRDIGQRVEITSIHPSITSYITTLYTIIDAAITLTDWKLEQGGYVKAYQVLQGSAHTLVSGTAYAGGATMPNTQISGQPTTSQVMSPLITNDFTFNGSNIVTYQLPYNTFYAVDTPIVISAVDTNNPSQPRLYFTLLNNVTLYNGPNYNA